MSGKGDAYRPVDREKYASNWDRIFAIKEDLVTEMSPHDVSVKLWLLKQHEAQSKSRETLDRGTEKAVDRCPNTIDIEEQIEQDRGTD
jgi:hypothetical protein